MVVLDDQKSIVRIVAEHRLDGMAEVQRAGNVSVVVYVVALSFGRTSSIKDCASGFGSSVGLLRATR